MRRYGLLIAALFSFLVVVIVAVVVEYRPTALTTNEKLIEAKAKLGRLSQKASDCQYFLVTCRARDGMPKSEREMELLARLKESKTQMKHVQAEVERLKAELSDLSPTYRFAGPASLPRAD